MTATSVLERARAAPTSLPRSIVVQGNAFVVGLAIGSVRTARPYEGGQLAAALAMAGIGVATHFLPLDGIDASADGTLGGAATLLGAAVGQMRKGR
jgi:hypothetical protein